MRTSWPESSIYFMAPTRGKLVILNKDKERFLVKNALTRLPVDSPVGQYRKKRSLEAQQVGSTQKAMLKRRQSGTLRLSVSRDCLQSTVQFRFDF